MDKLEGEAYEAGWEYALAKANDDFPMDPEIARDHHNATRGQNEAWLMGYRDSPGYASMFLELD